MNNCSCSKRKDYFRNENKWKWSAKHRTANSTSVYTSSSQRKILAATLEVASHTSGAHADYLNDSAAPAEWLESSRLFITRTLGRIGKVRGPYTYFKKSGYRCRLLYRPLSPVRSTPRSRNGLACRAASSRLWIIALYPFIAFYARQSVLPLWKSDFCLTWRARMEKENASARGRAGYSRVH